MAENENNKLALDDKSEKVQKKQKAKKEKKPSYDLLIQLNKYY